jgi:hypothetical protein
MGVDMEANRNINNKAILSKDIHSKDMANKAMANLNMAVDTVEEVMVEEEEDTKSRKRAVVVWEWQVVLHWVLEAVLLEACCLKMLFRTMTRASINRDTIMVKIMVEMVGMGEMVVETSRLARKGKVFRL